MNIPLELATPLAWSAFLAPLVWQTVKQGLAQAGHKPSKWAKFLGPRALGVVLFGVFAFGGDSSLSSDVWLKGGLVALFAPNLVYDLATGAVTKLAGGLVQKAARKAGGE